MGVHWKLQAVELDRETGEQVETDRFKSVPQSLGRKLLAEGCWKKVEEIAGDDGTNDSGPQMAVKGHGRTKKLSPTQKTGTSGTGVDTLG